MNKTRCGWTTDAELYIDYHDHEWGVPVLDDRLLFEFLILEGAQAGLSWYTVLQKRENYRQAFDGFDPEKIALYDETKVEELLQNQGIIRNRLKVQSAIGNAKSFLRVQAEYGSFRDYIWSFVGTTICYAFMQATGMVMDHTVDCFRYEECKHKE